jgi:GTP-binding protein EngB required for normal cell division
MGKSSVVNMLVGREVAMVGDDASGVTFASSCHTATINGHTVNLHDTVGLSEANGGRVSATRAAANLRNLIREVSNGGIHLLIYVTRERVPMEIDKKNYQMFHHALCKKEVPILFVVTALENLEDRSAYWTNKRRAYHSQDMYFDAFACIVSTMGPERYGEHTYQREYDASVETLRNLIWDNHSRTGYHCPDSWFASVQDNIEFLTNIVKAAPLLTKFWEPKKPFFRRLIG